MTETPTIGDVVADRYEVLGLIIEAPAYTAFRVRDREVEVDVALWWMKEALFPTDAARDAFVGAVVDVRGLIHPHLRRIFDAGRLFLTTQLGSDEGRTLHLGTGRRPPEFEVLSYATALTEALEAAHRLGHVHGLLIPSDLVKVAGQLKVGGVGLYRDVDPDGLKACFGDVRRYLAPEVFGGEPATPASDVYSMAAILCELASGVSGAKISDAAEALSASGQEELRVVLTGALRVAPDKRPERARDLYHQIRALFIDDRVPTTEFTAASGEEALGADLAPTKAGAEEVARPESEPPGPVDDLDAPTIQDSRPLEEESIPTTDYQRLEPAGKGDDQPSRDDGGATRDDGGATEVRRQPRDDGAEDPSTEREQPTARRPKETYRIFPLQSAEESGVTVEEAPAVDQPTVVDGEAPPLRADETLPDHLPPPPVVDGGAPAPPTGAEEPTGSEKPSFVSMKPEEEGERHPPPVAVVDRPEMQPKLRSLSSLSKSAPSLETFGRYAPPRPPGEAERKLARRLWILVAVVAVLVAGAILVTWLTVGGGARGGDGGATEESGLGAPTVRVAFGGGSLYKQHVPSDTARPGGHDDRAL